MDLLVWVCATSREAILTGYARRSPNWARPTRTMTWPAAAERFLAWLSGTERRWLVVLDDLADPADLDGLWPEGPRAGWWSPPGGRTRLAAPNRRVVRVGAFTMREALAYLTARLHRTRASAPRRSTWPPTWTASRWRWPTPPPR